MIKNEKVISIDDFVEECIKIMKSKEHGHQWKLNDDGEIDKFAYNVGHHNGVECILCGYSYCIHCNGLQKLPKCKKLGKMWSTKIQMNKTRNYKKDGTPRKKETNRYSLTIPIGVIRKIGWEKGTKLVCIISKKGLVLRSVKNEN